MAFIEMTDQELIDNGFAGKQQDATLDLENGILDDRSGWTFVDEAVDGTSSTPSIREYTTLKDVPINPIFLIQTKTTVSSTDTYTKYVFNKEI